jgi:hypothetical protein
VSAPQRFGKAGIRVGPRAGANNGTPRRHRPRFGTAGAPESLRAGRKSDATPHSGNQPPSGARKSTEGHPQRRRRSFGPARPKAEPGGPASAEQPGALSPGERQSRPRCTRSTFLGRTTPSDQTDQTGLAPDSPQRHWGPKRAQPPRGTDAQRQPAPPPLLGEAAPPAARPPGPAQPFLGRATEGPPTARQTNPPRGRGEPDHGTDGPPPSGGAKTAPRGLEASAPDAAPPAAPRSGHRRHRRHHAAPRSRKANKRDPGPRQRLFGRPPWGPTGQAPAPPPPRRQTPSGAHPTGSGAPRASLMPRQRPPRGPLNRHRQPPPRRQTPSGAHPTGSGTATVRPATPLGANEQTAAPRRAPRSPPQPKARDQRTAPGKDQKPKEASSDGSAATPSSQQRTLWWLKALRLANPPDRAESERQRARQARNSGKEQREGTGRGDTVQLPGREKLRRVCAIGKVAATPPGPSGHGGATATATWRTPWPVAGCNRPARC